jgi:type IV pilus assembly protein PilW
MNKRATIRVAPPWMQRGFTLIELMVSLAIGMVITLALLTLLINVNRNNAELSRTNSVIENGRFSLQLLEADLSHAGFWGGYVPSFDDLNWSGTLGTNDSATVSFPAAIPDPCAATSTWYASYDYRAQLIGVPLQVYQVPVSGTSPICTGFITNAQPSTDIVVVRHAAPCQAVSTASDTDCKYSATSGDMYFQFSRCATDTVSYTLTTTVAGLNLKPGNCTGTSPVYKFISTVYWVRSWFVTAPTPSLPNGDGIPTLVRTRFQAVTVGAVTTVAHQSTETLVDGIQAFRVALGVDNISKASVAGGAGNTLTSANFGAAVNWASSTAYYTPTNRGDGNADTYINCSTDTGGAGGASRCADPFYLANTVAVKLHVLVRASSTTPGLSDTTRKYAIGGDTLGPFSDGYKRHVYTQTVRLNNVSMRREVPSTL